MRKRISPIAYLISMFLFASNSLATPPDLASLDWSVKVPHNLVANSPDDDVIKTFMTNLNDDEAYPTGHPRSALCRSASFRHFVISGCRKMTAGFAIRS